MNRIASIILLITAGLHIVSSRPQVVNLRHPESQPRPVEALAPSAVNPNRPRHSAKPGDVVVHFDRNHEIQHLQYVLQNGQLATLYNRGPGNGVQVPMQVQPLEVHRRDDGTTPVANAPPPLPQQPVELYGMPYRPGAQPAQSQSVPTTQSNQQNQLPEQVHQVQINPEHAIEIVDSKDTGISRLIGGNHITIPMPDHRSGGEDEDDDNKLDVLATVAVDALHTGASLGQSKLNKAGAMLNKLRYKVSQKLHQLPDIIDKKLRIKSSPGQMFLDSKPNNRIYVIDDDSESRTLSQTDGFKVDSPQQANDLSQQRLEDSP